jgi:hypothetical protein
MEDSRTEVEGSGAGKGLREFPLQKIFIALHNAKKAGILAVRTPGFIRRYT